VIDAPNRGVPETEDDFLPLSGIQHLVFCRRQCALIHVEGVFRENHMTVDGRLRHAPADIPGGRRRQDVEVERSVWLRSRKLGLVGKADRVEIRADQGQSRLFPVESKRSRRRSFEADCVQLCAQAMALEEMRGVDVPRGALYYIRSRRRVVVEFTPDLRARTEEAARVFHDLVKRGEVPRAQFDARCRYCSLRAVCLPGLTERPAALEGHLQRLVEGDTARG
jgi:CRISPR-associated exonuclease Cas4